MFGKVGLRWCLSITTKPRGLVRPLDAAHGGNAAEGRQHHREGERQFVGLALTPPSSSTSSTDILPGSTLVDRGVGDPFDVALAQLALQQALGVADAVEAEMADIGLRR